MIRALATVGPRPPSAAWDRYVRAIDRIGDGPRPVPFGSHAFARKLLDRLDSNFARYPERSARFPKSTLDDARRNLLDVLSAPKDDGSIWPFWDELV